MNAMRRIMRYSILSMTETLNAPKLLYLLNF